MLAASNRYWYCGQQDGEAFEAWSSVPLNNAVLDGRERGETQSSAKDLHLDLFGSGGGPKMAVPTQG